MTGYKKIDYFKMNEDEDTPEDITMRLGTKPTKNVEFYEKFNCDWRSIKTLVKNKKKFYFGRIF